MASLQSQIQEQLQKFRLVTEVTASRKKRSEKSPVTSDNVPEATEDSVKDSCHHTGDTTDSDTTVTESEQVIHHVPIKDKVTSRTRQHSEVELMQIGLLQVGAMKSLGVLLGSRKLLEVLLVPKSPTKCKHVQENKDKQKVKYCG